MKRYPKYKPSGVEWIGEIPEGWNKIKLKYIGFLYSGLSGKSGDDFKQINNPLNKPFIPFTNIANNFKIDPNQLESVAIKEDDNQNQVKQYDLFFMMSSENYDDVGKATILLHNLGTVYLNSFCKGYRIVDKNVYPLFLNFLLFNDAYRRRMMIEANGFTRINLKMEKVNDFLIELPPIEEQTTIAIYLDDKTAKIDTLIEKKKKLIELLKEERTALIDQSVTRGINPNVKLKPSGIEWLVEIPEHWEVKKLKYVAKINPTSKNYNFEKDSEEEIIFLPMEKVSEDGIINQDVRKKIIEISSGFTYFEKDDIIVAKITPCFENGKAALLSNLETNFGFGSTEFHTLRATEIVNKQFLYYLLKSARFMTIGEAFMTGSAGQKRIPTDFVKEFITPIPHIEEQHQIVQHIESETKRIDSTITKIEKEIELLAEYRTALISEIVTGKIKVINN